MLADPRHQNQRDPSGIRATWEPTRLNFLVHALLIDWDVSSYPADSGPPFASRASETMLSLSPQPQNGYQSQQERFDAGPSDLLEDTIDRFEIFMPAVQSLVNALGGYEELETSPGNYETIYRPGDSVLAVLKDLKKLWRKDDTDDERTVARCMARAGLMKELLALLVECTDRGDWGKKVALVACKLHSGDYGGWG